jgi:hypothetical protein
MRGGWNTARRIGGAGVLVAGMQPAAVAVVLAGAVSATATAGQSVAICTSWAVAVPCASFRARPATIGVGADGRTMLVRLQWSGWSSATTRASGVLRSNAGPAGRAEYVRYGAVVVGSDIGRCDGHRVYRRLVIRSRGVGGTESLTGCSPQSRFGATSSLAAASRSQARHCSNAGTPDELFLAEITARGVSCAAARRFIIDINGHRLHLKYHATHYDGYACRPRQEGVAAWIRCTQRKREIRWIQGT